MIKLTSDFSDIDYVFVNSRHIESMYSKPFQNMSTMESGTITVINNVSGGRIQVKETPEKILDLIYIAQNMNK